MLVIVGATALLASLLTFFSGFGLGTLLLPVMALSFPPPLAVALTALVHFANGLFKVALTWREVRWPVVLRFGFPAVLAALLGASLLSVLGGLPTVARYELGGAVRELTPIKLVIAALMLAFAWAELSPRLKALELEPRWLPVGGVVSGFFGGLSGHQGAFRAAFLARLGLTPKAFVATGSAIAAVIDVARLSTYAGAAVLRGAAEQRDVVAVAVGAAFAGALLGNRLLPKMTLARLQRVVAVMLTGFALALGAGLL